MLTCIAASGLRTLLLALIAGAIVVLVVCFIVAPHWMFEHSSATDLAIYRGIGLGITGIFIIPIGAFAVTYLRAEQASWPAWLGHLAVSVVGMVTPFVAAAYVLT
ncbi:hypothetical protein CL628_03370 [bacterium]|nr:hypothetical protein [bacterium]